MKPISEIFSKSVNLLKQHKKLLIPFWALSMLFYVLFAIFLYGSGLYPAMNEYYGHVEAFNVIQAEHLSEEIGMEDNKIMTDFLSFMGTKRSGQDEEFKRYLEEQNYEYDAFKQMFNLNNLLLGAILFIVLIMGSLYLSCLAYLGVAGKIKRKSKELYGASLAFVPKYFIFQIIMGLIYLGPMIVIGTVVGFLFALNKVLGMIFLLLFILAMVAYFIWLAIKLIFATPALFLDDMGPIVAVKKSWNITKGKLGKVVILLLITAAMGVIGSSFVGEPMQSSFWSFAFHGSIFYLLLFLILSVISAAIAGLQVTFVMQAYDDIKGKK